VAPEQRVPVPKRMGKKEVFFSEANARHKKKEGNFYQGGKRGTSLAAS